MYLNAVCVSLECPLVVPGLEVPDLDGRVLARAHHQAEDRVEDDARHGRAVPRQLVLLRRPRDPLARRALLPRRRAGDIFLLSLRELGFQLIYLKNLIKFVLMMTTLNMKEFKLNVRQKIKKLW